MNPSLYQRDRLGVSQTSPTSSQTAVFYVEISVLGTRISGPYQRVFDDKDNDDLDMIVEADDILDVEEVVDSNMEKSLQRLESTEEMELADPNADSITEKGDDLGDTEPLDEIHEVEAMETVKDVTPNKFKETTISERIDIVGETVSSI